MSLADQFQCAHGKKCIELSQVCDGVSQCQDRSDELECAQWVEGCAHQCDNKSRCIPSSFLCDGERDCWDGSDEANCGTFSPNQGISFCSVFNVQCVERAHNFRLKCHLVKNTRVVESNITQSSLRDTGLGRVHF